MVDSQMKSQTSIISQLTLRWKRRILGMALISALISVVPIILIGGYFTISFTPLTITIGLILFVIFWFVFQVFPNSQQTISLIDHQFPAMENSSQLLDRPADTALEKIQLQKILEQTGQLRTLKFPLPWSMVAFTISLTLLSLVSFYVVDKFKRPIEQVQQHFQTVPSDTIQILSEADSLFPTQLEIWVSPPSYTGLEPYVSQRADMKAPEGSSITFSIQFSLPPDLVTGYWSGLADSFSKQSSSWTFQKKFEEGSIYQIQASKDTLNYLSPYHLIDIIHDKPPQIVISGIPQFQRFEWYEPVELRVKAAVTDDYGLSEVYLLATITEGSGESIRFREQRIEMAKSVSGNKIELQKVIKAIDFNMEPGNEFYFHIEAKDNKPSGGQITKSPTYFFAINDTLAIEFSLAGDLGADIMPDYFKSQLQLIIDTEKLLENKNQLSKKDFNFKSNELGYDQKQLRLRYGQFMGEEEDAGLEIAEEPEEAPAASEGPVNVLQDFGHDHDHENEAGQWMDRGTHPDHQQAEDDHQENPLEDYLHQHEDEETATFFTVSLKAKLRAALNEMWDAELYLRLFEPDKSLPYQYKALKLLKEIKNHARIYVKRVGFEPIEINEAETRLTRSPEDFSETIVEQPITEDPGFPGIEALILSISKITESNPALISGSVWETAGKEIAFLALEHPGKYFQELNAIQQLSQESIASIDYVRAARQLSVQLQKKILISNPRPGIYVLPGDELNLHFKNELIKSRQ